MIRFLFSFLTVFALSLGAATTNYYVATDGNDSNVGSLASPFLTLGKAQTTLRAEGPFSDGATVWVRGGTYRLASTFTLTGEDSGPTFSNRYVWRGYPSETAVIIGALPITNWGTYSGGIQIVDVSTQGIGGTIFNSLYFNGDRQHLARIPNYDGLYGGWSFAKNVNTTSQSSGTNLYTVVYQAGAVNTWTNIEHRQLVLHPGANWWNRLETITNINTTEKLIEFTPVLSAQSVVTNNRFFIQNVFEELNAAGEWYLDQTNSLLYFYPPAAITAENPVYVPTVGNLVTFASGASNIMWRNFTMQYATNTALWVTNGTNIIIGANKISLVGEWGNAGIRVTSGYTNAVIGNDISEVGANGIWITGGNKTNLFGALNYADNNYIHDWGQVYKDSVGIQLVGVGLGANRNTIHTGPRSGIHFAFANNSFAMSNHIYNAILETDDAGGIYIYGGDWIAGRGCGVIYNFIHDIPGWGFYATLGEYRTNAPWDAFCVYLDDLAHGVDIKSNVLVNASYTGVFINGGRDNQVYNNIIAHPDTFGLRINAYNTNSTKWSDYYLSDYVPTWDMAKGQTAWNGMRGMDVGPTNIWPGPDGYIVGGNRIATNVFYNTNSAGVTPNFGLEVVFVAPVLPPSNHIDWNNYYYTVTNDWQWFNTNITWGNWQALGLDVNSSLSNSLVEANWLLNASSPALGWGFEQIYVTATGAYPDDLRASWPLGSSSMGNIGILRTTTLNVGTITQR